MGEHDEAIAANRANWDQRADVHARSRMYDVEGLLADPARISEVVRNDLAVLAPHVSGGTVAGKSLLHLQCHIGSDTICWARLGAVDVHGLDLSPNSLAHARRLSEADGAGLTLVEGDARRASEVVDRRFEVIVTSAGTIVWLPELRSWARSIRDLLEPGGVFMIRDDHPILGAMGFRPWQVTEDYLSGGGANVYDEAATYTDGSVDGITHTVNHEWRHDLAEVTGALLSAGLVIEALGEHPFMDWPAFDGLVACPEGWRLPDGAPRIPLNFSVVARRPH
ncbi:SAM-dependent methyltransferase [Actinoalloteichus hoggarensis]|uniref:Methyltransferase domain protein n=1 Tax=Actinoalloteichus hoggarensis TaxID=1470176 RepID=A0A221VVW8_9PSEU|nr:class I SAM-dependent methyltransferase [Actinoalloteichus hoggarensis]ASO17692.1 Methyltransferase domain protein [Actinoalloteichus hoggarensis]MBB5922817.1 SAM-dependent methyltransferase [Actinoalloteichus hoggarensis]